MFNNINKILVLAPHTDDGEFGCGGSLAKFIQRGVEVYYAAFSTAEESLPPEFPPGTLELELKAAARVLGIPEGRVLIHRYQVRNLARHRQDILEDLVQLNERLNPDLVFLPCLQDLHQDHSTVAMEGLRAFKRQTILGYEIPWNNLNFRTQCFVALDEDSLGKKLRALDCYNSQKNRYYASEDFVRSLARTRGTQIGVPYAEVFEVIRWIM